MQVECRSSHQIASSYDIIVQSFLRWQPMGHQRAVIGENIQEMQTDKVTFT